VDEIKTGKLSDRMDSPAFNLNGGSGENYGYRHQTDIRFLQTATQTRDDEVTIPSHEKGVSSRASLSSARRSEA